MIRISIKGLAKYIEASPAAQRKILQDFKFPDEDEPYGMRLYYQDATKILQFHRDAAGPELLNDAAEEFLSRAASADKPNSARRLRNNARAVKQYAEHFGGRQFELREALRLSLTRSGVLVSVAPDLHVRERGRQKLIKLEFAEVEPSDQTIKTLTQGMFEAAVASVPDLATSSVLLFDVPRGRECRGARAGARTLREIEAACENIAQVWASIGPPTHGRRRRQ